MSKHYGGSPIPAELAKRAARYWFGERVSEIRPNVAHTVHNSDGGSYTLHGTRISGAYGEWAMIYEDNGFVIQFYDNDGGRITQSDDGHWWEFRSSFGGNTRKF